MANPKDDPFACPACGQQHITVENGKTFIKASTAEYRLTGTCPVALARCGFCSWKGGLEPTRVVGYSTLAR